MSTRPHANLNRFPSGTAAHAYEELHLEWCALLDAIARALGIGRLLGWPR